MALTNEERIFLLEQMFHEGGNYTVTVKNTFSERFQKPLVPHHNAVRRIVAKVCETGSVEVYVLRNSLKNAHM